MPNTTNYNWVTPADSDLVKDGAAAIRTLGSSIDTSVKSLNAGTTAGDLDYYTSATAKTRVAIGTSGQSLTVVGGVPAWAASPTSVLTAKGDVLTATAANTIARLGVGANDTVLTADSTTATGLKWATPASGGMTLISTTTLTGASVTLSSIPQTYNNLYIVAKNFLPSTDSENIRVRLNGDSAARYLEGSGAFSGTFLNLTGSNDNAVTQNFSVMNLWDYTNTTTWKTGASFSYTNNATTPANVSAQNVPLQCYNQTAAITSILFYPGSGNFTSGTLLLYGVK